MTTEKKQRVTLREIARETGYAVITVSKALRDERDIAQNTKRIIREKAREMGYVQNAAANALRSGKSMMIAASIIDIMNPYWNIYCKHIERQSYEKGYVAIFMDNIVECETEPRLINMAVQRGVDGVLLDPSMKYRENVKLLENVGIPYVLVGWPNADQRADAVWYDNVQSGYLAGKHLVERGCRKILMLNIPSPFPVSKDRERGLMAALREAAFPEENIVQRRLAWGQGAPISLVREIFDEHPDIDGIYAFNDYSALQLLSSLKAIGRRVPEDVAVVSMDDVQQSISTGIRLTTVHATPIKMAQVSLDLLMRRISGDYSDFPAKICLPVHLVEGET
ncbi:MAG: LacI family DNA-binding transcriptional regulator [Clostridia bacterium]|nr:LacI family DNA-binding transcriptional regulator [Clostridia bacterium]